MNLRTLEKLARLWRQTNEEQYRVELAKRLDRQKIAHCAWGIAPHEIDPRSYDDTKGCYYYEFTRCKHCLRSWPQCDVISDDGYRCVLPKGHMQDDNSTDAPYIDAWHRGPLDGEWIGGQITGRLRGWVTRREMVIENDVCEDCGGTGEIGGEGGMSPIMDCLSCDRR